MKRNSSIELLRILSVFAIVIHHYGVHGTLDCMNFSAKYAQTLKINLFLNFLGKLGVVLFVMIGAYFLCEKRFKYRRPVNLILTMAFYSFGLFLVLRYWFPTDAATDLPWLNVWLPFPLPSGYWFIYAYIFMLLMMPGLNLVIKHFAGKKLNLLIFCIIIMWSLIPLGINLLNGKPDTSADFFGYSIGGYFLLIYLVSAAIRESKLFKSLKFTAVGAVLSVLLVVIICAMMDSKTSFNVLFALFQLNSPLILLVATFIFSFFKNLTFHSRIINFLAGSMFGVYLIHEDSFVRPLIWQQLISSIKVAGSPSAYLHQAVTYSLLVFCVCVLIDIVVRRLLFSKLINKLTEWISKALEKLTAKVLN